MRKYVLVFLVLLLLLLLLATGFWGRSSAVFIEATRYRTTSVNQ